MYEPKNYNIIRLKNILYIEINIELTINNYLTLLILYSLIDARECDCLSFLMLYFVFNIRYIIGFCYITTIIRNRRLLENCCITI